MAVNAKRRCAFDGCTGEHHARGWCTEHYTRWRVYGTPDRELAWETKFWIYADVGHPTACWEWTRSRARGYGRFHDSSLRRVMAHRYAYELLIGPIPDGLYLDHICRNPPCVNPIHLEPVTAKENTRRSPIISQWREDAQAKCAEPECDNYGRLSRGLCSKHYKRVYSAEVANRPRPACAIEGCMDRARALKGGICNKHQIRLRKHGDPHVKLRGV